HQRADPMWEQGFRRAHPDPGEMGRRYPGHHRRQCRHARRREQLFGTRAGLRQNLRGYLVGWRPSGTVERRHYQGDRRPGEQQGMRTEGAIGSANADSFVSAGALPLAAPVSWCSRAMVLAALFILVGIVWDISWHSTIGRDTFWTPAHICIHFGGSLDGFVCGWLVLRATFFGTTEDRAAAVRVWGFRGPLGAWVTIWGALAMLTSAPFDNWWHDAYGLDVKILSPPHSVLAAGMYFHVAGGLLLLLGVQNRSADVERPAGRWLFVLAA